jgi:putative transposase
MPAKNIVKIYKGNRYYHIYNRGVGKQQIFTDLKDYKMFLFYLKLYLSPSDLQGPTLKVSPSRRLNNFFDQIKLAAYCLMPNHYHLLLHQTEKTLIRDFMHSMGTKYSLYFNTRYKRRGPLFEGNYKAVLVDSNEQLVYLTKYIHRNPENILPSRLDLEGYQYSSYANYLGFTNQTWLKTQDVLSIYQEEYKQLSYKDFVEKQEEDLKIISNYMLD